MFVYKNCFCYLNVENVKQKKRSLAGILTTIGDVTDIFGVR